ncbi:diphthine--ammonia ligase [Halocatena salina]|uniref:Diphthine--ammonia ligase n=1 Tax=Halocatena salina TaxID=2934340 RepID=A0A8U0A1T6_9EURY|nr:diphthine--ammonia ligase [Halocatena salina]UPM42003.1 diphthine--ammonia ligase [Halocatena salina]
MTDTPWVSLFSGGKDSSWALYRALEAGHPIERLVTVHPEGDSYMYHVPATELASLAAESIGISLLNVRPEEFDTGAATDASEQGDREIEPLERALETLNEEQRIGGVTVGAVESDYQNARVKAMCDRLGAELFAPLWHENPTALAHSMLEAGFEITIVQVAAAGLDESWLGRTLDEQALRELRDLNDRYGVHVLGEGGEYETIVTDGPHMTHPIELEYDTEWDGQRGRLLLTDAWLGGTR